MLNANKNTKNQTGTALIPILIALVVILAGAVGYLTIIKKPAILPVPTGNPTTPTENGGLDLGVPVVNPTTGKNANPTQNPAVPADWKTYRNEQYGFEFRYPSEYSDSKNFGGEGVINISIGSKNDTIINLIREPLNGDLCTEFLCDEPAKKQLSMNGINWDYLGMQHYCDAGGCSLDSSVYRTIHGDGRYYMRFYEEKYEADILVGFKFIK